METNILKIITAADIASLANAVCGLLAMFTILTGNTLLSAQLLLLAVVFDSIDGTIARKLKTNTQEHKLFGETIDSLADIVSFGAAPAIALSMMTTSYIILIPMILLVACGILRLTRYNAMQTTSQTPVNSFIGLPIPVTAMLLGTMFLSSFTNYILLTAVFIIVSILMVSSIQYPKIKDTKIIAIIGILTILCIIPGANTILFSIPSYILLILTFIYIFGTILYNYMGFSNQNKPFNKPKEVFENITINKSKSKKDLHRK